MTRMTQAQEDLRGDLEDALARLSAVDGSLRLVEKRLRLYMERQPRIDRTLAGIFDELQSIKAAISTPRAVLSDLHEHGQRTEWRLWADAPISAQKESAA